MTQRRHLPALAPPITTRTTITTPRPTRRCETCACYLAHDNRYTTCTPCQRRAAGTPPFIQDYLATINTATLELTQPAPRGITPDKPHNPRYYRRGTNEGEAHADA